jgi:TRAP-type uncharacterized transport system fused permease subunit
MKDEDRFEKFLDVATLVIGVGMTLYHLVSTQILFHSTIEHEDVHLGCAFLLVFLISIRNVKNRKSRLLGLALAAAGLFVTAYFKLEYERLAEMMGFALQRDFFVGVLMILLVLEGTRRIWGPVIPVLSIIAILYFFLGHLIPGYLGHPYIPPTHVIAALAVGLDTGILGPFM